MLREKEGLTQDKSAAEQALSDLDRIIAGKSDVSALGITVPNARYYAGNIAWSQLHSDFRAYSYWQGCYLINYFSGSIDAKAFENITATAKSATARCDAYFNALWYADITHDTALAKNYYDQLAHFDQFACGSALVFAEKFRH